MMHGFYKSIAKAVTAIGLVTSFSAYAADNPRVVILPRVSSHIRVDANLVLIPVTVTDSKNHPITGLEQKAFRIFENKTEQKIVNFMTDDAPVSVGIVFDSSGSMRDKLAKSREAVAGFFNTANPRDEFFLVEFNRNARVTVPFTHSPELIQDRLMGTESGGKTALFDAVHMALSYMKNATNTREALLLISDGVDNNSRYSGAEMRNIVREADTWIYTIAICRQSVVFPEEEPAGTRLLTGLAEETGGRQFSVRNPNQLPDIAEKIGLELRNQYILGFKPSERERDGKYHRVKVQLNHTRPLNVSSRPGYYAPLN